MTSDGDYILLQDTGQRIACKANHIHWPPPVIILLNGKVYRRERFTELAEDRRRRPSRGAVYDVDTATKFVPIIHT